MLNLRDRHTLRHQVSFRVIWSDGGAMRLRLIAVPILVLATIMAFSAANGPQPSFADAVWNVQVGSGGQGVGIAAFLPEAITIHSGDTIHFVDPNAWEPHTVTSIPPGGAVPDFTVGTPQPGLNPLAAYPSFNGSGVQRYDPSQYYNSGLLNQNDAVDVSFSKTGTFSFICLIHGGIDPATGQAGGMHIDVTVVPQGGAGPTSQDVIDAAATAQRTTLISAGTQAASTLQLTQAKLSDGTTNWGVTAGGSGLASLDPEGVTDIPQFSPSGLSINTGDTVTWTNNTGVPHTVTFLSGGPDVPLVTPLPGGVGPPFLAINPLVQTPAGGPTYDGTGYVNSGFISTGGGANTFALTFTKAGTYQYICHLHDQVGMIGTVNVSDAAAPTVPPVAAPSTAPPARPVVIAPPDTGTGPPPSGSGGWPIAIVVLDIIGASIALAGTRLVGRRTD